MQYDFLKHFPKRMKHVGLYVMLVQNSLQKTTWKKYGFQKTDQQFNMIFAVFLYIMEQSLKEEPCTMDDIGAFIDAVNTQYFEKQMTYQECCALGDFIVNVILSNEGKAMYFEGFDFEQKASQAVSISYVANKIVYSGQDVKRTSYYLTDDGYNLLLSTLEIENNMKLTIHEMIFHLHLEKQSYDKAVDDIKNIFNLLRIQLQKIQEAMGKIRRNALNYSVRDYQEILNENLDTISRTKQEFQDYRELVRSRAQELEEANINVRRLSGKEEEKLVHLREIEQYLNRAIDEHQKILGGHFDLKSLYARELEALSQMSLIRRFSLRTEFYDKVLEQPQALTRLEYFLRPLFCQEPGKAYNLNQAFQLQKPLKKSKETDTEELLEFDAKQWEQERERLVKEKLARYEKSLSYLLSAAVRQGEITLKELSQRVKEREEERERLIPDVEIFKEIMVELIRSREIDIPALQKEQSEYIKEQSGEFQLNVMLLSLAERFPEFGGIERIETSRLEEDGAADFPGTLDAKGDRKTIRCSNVRIRITRKAEETAADESETKGGRNSGV